MYAYFIRITIVLILITNILIFQSNSIQLKTINSRKISRQQVFQLKTSNKQEISTQSNIPSGKIIIELTRHRKYDNENVEIIAYESVYKEVKDDKLAEALESNYFKAFELLLNPLTLLLILYFSSASLGRLIWTKRLLRLFGKGPTKEMEKAKAEEFEKAPYQVFECENCGMELRPAKGRAEVIFSRERFRCARCGAKASAYFDIANLDDPRAVARIERLKIQKEKEESGEDDEEDDVNVDDEDE